VEINAGEVPFRLGSPQSDLAVFRYSIASNNFSSLSNFAMQRLHRFDKGNPVVIRSAI